VEAFMERPARATPADPDAEALPRGVPVEVAVAPLPAAAALLFAVVALEVVAWEPATACAVVAAA
jgi:hypothetical protein